MLLAPPMLCVLCGESGQFNSVEHLVPESLGNDILVLGAGWLCDACNNICSGFESRALSSSILGVERCRLGVVTKKRKPARASLFGVLWEAEPLRKRGVVSAEADWSQIPILPRADGTYTMAFPLHDTSNYDIAKLLLKMGLELLAVHDAASGATRDRSAAKGHVLV